MLQAIVLGLVQGLTEFLPVSSSGHLVIVPYLLGWEAHPLAVDVALHGGTLLALLVYFAGDLWYLATRTFGVGVLVEGEAAHARRTVLLLAVGTVPAAAVGATLAGPVEEAFAQPRLAGALLLVTALLLYVAERIRRRRAVRVAGSEAAAAVDPATDPGRDEGTTGLVDALTVGLFQAVAVLPGISRSGATIAGGMLRGLSRDGAARFSFLLSIPIVAGAAVAQLGDLAGPGGTGAFSGLELAVAVATAALSGLWAIRFLLRLVTNRDLLGFARYAAFFGALTILATVWLGPASSV